MVFLALVAAVNLASAAPPPVSVEPQEIGPDGDEAPRDAVTQDRKRSEKGGGTLNGGGDAGKKNGGGKKGGGKKGGGKKGGGKKGGGKKGGGKKSSKNRGGAAAPWGDSFVMAGGGIGYAHGITREADETGKEKESESGSTSTSCVGNNCTTSDSKTNAATGWGNHMEFAFMLPGIGNIPSTVAPRIGWGRHSLQLEGLKHSRPAASSDGDLTTAFVSDRADYNLQVDQVDLGVTLGLSFSRQSPFFLLCNVGVGYAWGTVETTLQSAPAQTYTGAVSGLAVGFDFGLGLSIAETAHFVLMPFTAPNWLNLRPEDDESFPFLTDGKSFTSTIPVKFEALISF